MYFRKLFTLMPVLAAFLSQSCINDNAPCKTSDYGEESLFINIDLSVPVSTRSAGHIDEPGQAAENFIDLEDCKIYIFDKDGKYADLITEIESSMPTDAPNGKYTITAKLELPNKETKENLSTFNVMVLANCTTFTRSDTPWNFDGYSLTGDTKNIYKEGSAFNFNFANLTTSSAWVPTQTEGIPMFGVTTEGVDLQLAIDMGKYGDYPSFSVSMLRALAKIEIANMTPVEDEVTIESCTLTNYNTKGRFIPDITVNDNTTWYDSAQISEASLPSDYSTGQLDDQRLLFVPSSEDDKIRIAYIPEIDLAQIPDQDKPQVEVWVNVGGSPDGPYYIDFGTYDAENGQFTNEYYSALLRNHNYRFNIMSVGSTELDFIVQTPWEETPADEWLYEDPKIVFESGKEFQWDWTNVDDETELPKFESGQITERTIIITQDDWLQGTFRLKSPANAKWTISVYGDENTLNDHFYVQTGNKEEHEDMDGKTYESVAWNEGGPSVSGNVGKDVLFRIIPSAVNNSDEHYVARVVFTITTFDDRIMEVNLPFYANDNYKVEGSEMPYPTIDNNGYYYVKQYYSGFKDVEDNEPERPEPENTEGSTDEQP